MAEDQQEPRGYPSAVACSIAGINPVTLRSWRSRGILSLGTEGEGWTRYSFFDIAALVAMKELQDDGYRAEEAAAIAVALRGAFQALVESTPVENWDWAWAVIKQGEDGPFVRVAHGQPNALQLSMDGFGFRSAHVLRIGSILRHVADRLSSIRAKSTAETTDANDARTAVWRGFQAGIRKGIEERRAAGEEEHSPNNNEGEE